MQNDTISRSALVAELENFKVTAGDPVIRLIIDRVIGIVKEHPAAEVNAADEKRQKVKDCWNCANSDRPSYEWPCTACTVCRDESPSKWEAAPNEAV